MKKTIFFAIAVLLTFTAFSQVPSEISSDSTVRDSVTKIPETLWVVINGDSIGIPTTDAKIAAETVKEIIKENDGNWPKTVLGWVTLVLGIIFSARGTVFITSGKRIYAFLKSFLKKTLNIVAFVAGMASAGITFLVGRGSFDWQVFMTVWGIVAFIGVYIYETWIKKPEPGVAKKV